MLGVGGVRVRNVDGVFLNPGAGVFPSSVDIYSTGHSRIMM